MNLAADFKDSKGFYKYIRSKKKTKENLDPRDLMIEDMKRTEILNATFTSFFISKAGL